MKRWMILLAVLLAVCLLQPAVQVRAVTEDAAAENAVTQASGKCGDNLTWTLDSTGRMTISGTGRMWDFRDDAEYFDYHPCPWESLKDQITSVVFRSGVTYVGANAFYEHENLKTVTFAESITQIGHFAFCWCRSLQNFTLPSHLQAIRQQAFCATAITAITIPGTVTFIDSICENCTQLTYVRFEACTSFGSFMSSDGLFRGCTALEAINVDPGHGALRSVDGVLFQGDILIQYPLGRRAASYTVPAGTTDIMQYSMEGAQYLEHLTLADSVTEVPIHMAAGCPRLTSVVIPDSVQIIKDGAFIFCENLTDVRIGDGVKDIERDAFYSCESLKSIYIPESVTTIGERALGYSNYIEKNGGKTGLTIHGIPGSAAEQYARENGIAFSVAPARITSQPQNASGAVGTNAVFTVRASGSKLQYQWQYQMPGSTAWTNTTLTGAKTASLTVPVTDARNNCRYRCQITDSEGRKLTSNAAALTVRKPVEITGHPGTKTVNEGETALFGCVAQGQNLSYQWQYKMGSGAWTNTTLSGCRTAFLSVPATAARNGCQYRCVVKNAAGYTAYSNAATLTVRVPFALTSQPAAVTAAAGASARFTVGATGTGLTYQWQYQLPGSTVWTSTTLTGAKTASLTVPATTARNNCKYRCVVKDAAGTTLYSNPATLTVKSLVITGHPGTKTVAVGTNAQFGVIASGVGLTYQWQYKIGSGAWTNTTLTGCRTSLLTVPATAARNGCQYRCVVKDAAGTTLYTNPATLTVR